MQYQLGMIKAFTGKLASQCGNFLQRNKPLHQRQFNAFGFGVYCFLNDMRFLVGTTLLYKRV
jgi:hypothetical protein